MLFLDVDWHQHVSQSHTPIISPPTDMWTLNIARYRGRNLIWAVNVVWAWMKPVRGSISRWCRSSFGTLNCNFNALVALKTQKTHTHCQQLCISIAGKCLHCRYSNVTMTEQITTWQQLSASQPVLPSTPSRTVSKLSSAFCNPSPATAYLAVISTHMAVGRFQSPVRRSGTRCLTSSEIRRVVLTVLSSFLRQSCFVFTNVTSTLEVFLNVMCYINPRFSYLLTYLQSIHKRLQ